MMNTATTPPTDGRKHAPTDHEMDHEMEHAARARLKMGLGQKAVVALLLAVVLIPPLAGFYSYFTGIPLHLVAAKKGENPGTSAESVPPSIRLVAGHAHTLEISDEVAAALGIRKEDRDAIAVAQPPTLMRPLVLPGSTAIIPGRLARIKPRFAAARVIEIAQVQDRSPKTGYTEYRELRPGDRVSKGDMLGVFYSVDVGSKKNDLLQALVQLELDQKIMDRVEANRYSIPEVYYLTQIRAVQGDRTEVNRALMNLKTWDIPQEEIDALDAEAKKISANKDDWFQMADGRWVMRAKHAMNGKEPLGVKHDPGKESLGIKHDPGKEKEEENPWGRVTLRAPFDGVIIEQNVHKDEMMSDPTINLWQIADVSQILVIANCPEDDLPTLEALQGTDKRWTVRTVGASPTAGLSGLIAEIGYVIDPNQHTAVIKGYVDNPGQHIRGGQYVSATVNIPPPRDVVEIPVDALVDDGRQSLVFVQPDAAKSQFTMRRVQVTHRFDRTVFVRATPIPKEEQLTAWEAEEGLLPKEPIRPGERVLTAGSVELKRVAIDLESRPKEKPADGLAKAKARSVSELAPHPEQKGKTGKG
ncbi:MAG: efflux RND transporter periplasmic adaptor subunit [Isosphaeraceae bacterium]